MSHQFTMNSKPVYSQQNLHDLARINDTSINKRSKSFGDFAIFQQTRTIREAASSFASKIRKVVKPNENTSSKAVLEIQEFAEVITKNRELWDDFRTKLIHRGIVTNTAVTFFLISYVSERRNVLEMILEESKNKKQEKPKGAQFMRRIRNSTESLTNLASAGIKNIHRRTSFEVVRRNRESHEGSIQNIPQTFNVSNHTKKLSSCQTLERPPQEQTGKNRSSISLPTKASFGSENTRRLSFNFLRRNRRNSSENSSKKVLPEQRIGVSVSEPKRYAELPRKLSADFDISSYQQSKPMPTGIQSYSGLASRQQNQSNQQWDLKSVTPPMSTNMSTVFPSRSRLGSRNEKQDANQGNQGWDVKPIASSLRSSSAVASRQVTTSLYQGNQQWDVKPVTTGTLEKRLNSNANFSIAGPTQVKNENTIFKADTKVNFDSRNGYAQKPNLNVNGVKPQVVFGVQNKKVWNGPFSTHNTGHGNTAELKHDSTATMKRVQDTATLTSSLNTSMGVSLYR